MLPDRFVLKCNHNSGKGMCICKDKSRLDREKTVSGLREGLAENYFIKGREWCYRDIPRKIVGEQYIENDDGTDISDYKVICGDGEPRYVEVHRARFTAHTLDCYDLNGKRLDVSHYYNTSGILLPDHLPSPVFDPYPYPLAGQDLTVPVQQAHPLLKAACLPDPVPPQKPGQARPEAKAQTPLSR